MDKLKDRARELPDSPGVYLFKDSGSRVIYIGKAKSLRKRVLSYLNHDLSAKTQVMVSKISDLEYRLTPSESQAQILEAALVKELKPQYNISLKDDKSFPLIRITGEDFPVISIYRRKKASGADTSLYFGPYTNAGLLREALKVIRRIFTFRSCRIMPNKICLFGRIKLCPAPCIGNITSSRYKDTIKKIILLLEFKEEELLHRLSRQMKEAAKEERFEEAAKLRDQLGALSAITQADSKEAALSQLEDLQNLAGLEKIPERIEAFDISNISGQEACGSMVSFFKGSPDKNNYRRFRIKTVLGIDDYAMLAEVVGRRYFKLVSLGLALPDLIIIDGGRGHLLTAGEELKKLGLEIPLLSIAKEYENIYISGRQAPVKLKSGSRALNLIRKVRDEAHRFAVAYHHLLRKKKLIGRRR
jgi:excinuclease ABC subunit C